METFLNLFRDYLESDGRHHIWITSLPTSSTLVYENHNVIYAYGPLEEFEQVLIKRGLTECEVQFPVPHVHNYHSAFDADECEIMTYWKWGYFPLVEHEDYPIE